MIYVKATREGLVGKTTSTGWVITVDFPFVALPSVNAKHKWIKISNPLNGLSTCAQVLDTGPFSEIDDAYVFGGARPLSESNMCWLYGKPAPQVCLDSNGSGIDLGEYVWRVLGMEDNTQVSWEFVL